MYLEIFVRIIDQEDNCLGNVGGFLSSSSSAHIFRLSVACNELKEEEEKLNRDGRERRE